MTLEKLLNQRDQLANDIMSIIDPHFSEKNPVYIAKSLRDIRFSLLFIIEGLILGEQAIIENYLLWLEETFTNYGIKQEATSTLFDAIKVVLKNYLSEEKNELLTSVDFTSADYEYSKNNANPLQNELDNYVNLLLSGEKDQAKNLVHKLLKSNKLEDIYIHIFQDGLYEIGKLWQMNKIGVADEHFATVVTQYIMTTLYPYVFSTKKHDKKLLASAIGTELHEVGIRMVSDLFEIDGWNTSYLGANIPASEIIKYAKKFEPDLLALSVTLPIHLNVLKESITIIKQEIPTLKILVGGGPFNRNKNLYKSMGADGYATDGVSAVKVGNNIVNS